MVLGGGPGSRSQTVSCTLARLHDGHLVSSYRPATEHQSYGSGHSPSSAITAGPIRPTCIALHPYEVSAVGFVNYIRLSIPYEDSENTGFDDYCILDNFGNVCYFFKKSRVRRAPLARLCSCSVSRSQIDVFMHVSAFKLGCAESLHD